jgi:hypothetical protein
VTVMAPTTATIRTVTITLALALAAGVHALASAQGKDGAAIDLQGKLYRSVFSSGPGALSADALTTIPEPLKGRLERYLARRAAFKSSYKSEADSFEKVRVDAKRRLLEQAIVSLIDAPDIERRAADYVTGAPIRYEWEGLHEGPLAEAGHAEALLEKDPASPLAPWFAAFIAQRQRVAFETFAVQKDEAGMKTAAGKYRTFLARARAAADPIFAALATDMDRQPYLYLKTTLHPRDY